MDVTQRFPIGRRGSHRRRMRAAATSLVTIAFAMVTFAGTASATHEGGVEHEEAVESCPAGMTWNPIAQACVENPVVLPTPDPAPAAVKAVPDEVFADPAVDTVDRTGALAYGAATTPDDGGVSPEKAVAVAGSAAAPSAPAVQYTGTLPYTGLATGTALYLALLLFILGAFTYGEAGRASRRAHAAT